MIEKIAEKIAKQQIKTPKLFFIIFALITIILIPGIPNLVNNVEPSLEKVLPQTIDEVKTMNDMRTQFGADMMYLVLYAEGPILDVRNPALLKYIDTLENKIQTHEKIINTKSIAGIIKNQNQNIIPNSLRKTKELLSQNLYTQELVNADYSLTIIQIKSDTGSSAQLIKKTVNSIKKDIENLEEINPGSRIEITGFNAIDKATFEVIMSDFASITLVSMILISIVVFLTFKSLLKGMLPMIIVINSLIWTMGIIGYLGLTITVVSMVSAAMIMGLGIDFGIHTVHTYFEKRKKENKKQSLIKTQKELLRAMLGASLTTMAGFLALLFGVLPAMKTLSIILALGILNTLIGAVFLLPLIVYLYDLKFNKKKKQIKNPNWSRAQEY